MNKKRRIPWNKGKLIGDKLPFEKHEVRKIKKGHKKQENLRGYVTFSVAIDSSLRSGDLLSLKGRDVRSTNGMIKQEVSIYMEKTKKRITFILFDDTREALLQYMIENGIQDDDYLFPGRWKHKPLSRESFRKFIKSCAEMIGLNPEHYSGHSTRRTRAIFLALEGVQDTLIAELLGVTVKTVKSYIRRAALQLSKKYPM